MKQCDCQNSGVCLESEEESSLGDFDNSFFCKSAAMHGINFVAENRFEDMVTKHIKSADLLNTMEALERAAASLAFAQQWIERTIGVLSARVIIGAAVGNDEIIEGSKTV
nr:hypothetical protein [Ferrovum sp.]